VNSAKTELQVQEEMDKKRLSTSAPRGRGATPYTERVKYEGVNLLKSKWRCDITHSLTAAPDQRGP